MLLFNPIEIEHSLTPDPTMPKQPDQLGEAIERCCVDAQRIDLALRALVRANGLTLVT